MYGEAVACAASSARRFRMDSNALGWCSRSCTSADSGEVVAGAVGVAGDVASSTTVPLLPAPSATTVAMDESVNIGRAGKGGSNTGGSAAAATASVASVPSAAHSSPCGLGSVPSSLSVEPVVALPFEGNILKAANLSLTSPIYRTTSS